MTARGDATGSTERNAAEAHASPVLLESGRLLDLASSGAIPVQDADILIANGIVSRIAPHGAIEFPSARHLDAKGCLILPGLTNGHTHSPENLAAGFCEGLQLESWVKAVWAQLDHLTGDQIRLAVCFGAAQMLKRGVTAVVDHFRQTPMSIDALDTALAAYASTGMRAMIAVMLRDRVGDDGRLLGAPTGGRALSIQAIRELWTEAAKRHDPDSRVAVGLGPSGPTRCTDEMLEVAVEISRQHSLCLHTHVAETRFEVDAAYESFGCRAIRHLSDLGFLGPRTSLAHCVWVDDEEVNLIARSGAIVVHNPISNMALGSGIAPVQSMLAAGARVGLGTDGAASNGGQDIFESVKCAALLARCGTPEAGRWLTARQALGLAICGGREIFGLRPSTIAEGAVADIAVFPIAEDTLEEFSDPVRQLVYGAQARARHVLVAGDAVVVDGRPTWFDESEVQAELHRIRRSSMTKHARNRSPRRI